MTKTTQLTFEQDVIETAERLHLDTDDYRVSTGEGSRPYTEGTAERLATALKVFRVRALAGDFKGLTLTDIMRKNQAAFIESMRERGYTPGKIGSGIDEVKKTHGSMHAWDDLPESERFKSRIFLHNAIPFVERWPLDGGNQTTLTPCHRSNCADYIAEFPDAPWPVGPRPGDWIEFL